MKSENSKTFRRGTWSLALCLVVAAVLIAVNIFVQTLPDSAMKKDISPGSYYSLGELSKNVLAGVQEDVELYVLADENSRDDLGLISELLPRYTEENSHIHLTYIDPAVNPQFAAQYEADTASVGSIIVSGAKRSTVVDYQDLYVTDYSAYYTTGEVSSYFNGEQEVTSAIDFVVSDDLPKMLALTGHEEAALPSEVSTAIAHRNVELTEWNLLKEGEIPEDTDAVLIYCPGKDISETEKDILLDYLENGGALLVIPVLSLSVPEMPQLNEVLSAYGMTLDRSLVMEGDEGAYFQTPYAIFPQLAAHTITDPIRQAGSDLLLLNCQGIRISEDVRSTLTVTPLAQTTETAYEKVLSEMDETTGIAWEEGDPSGAFVLAAAAEEETENGTAKVVVVSCHYLLADEVISRYSVANEDFFTNAVSWMCGHESTISIEGKKLEAAYLQPTAAQVNVTRIIVYAVPAALAAVGVVIWLIRRRK